MEQRRWVAAGGSLALHAAMVAAALVLAGQAPRHERVQPLEVALIRPTEPLPTAAAPAAPPKPPAPVLRPPPVERPVAARPPPPARPPRPQPVRPAPPVQPPAPAPVVPTPAEEPRPAAPTAAPADAPTAAPGPAITAPGAPREAGAAGPAREPAAPAPQRVGPRLDASWSGNSPPPYPAMARRLGDQGEVRLDIHVGADGSVLDVKLRKSSGSQLLDRTAIDTVKKWRFRPATVDGKPVPEWYHDWKWVFRLEN